MSENTEDLQVSELDSLKARATMLGITFHPSIGLDKLREKVNAVMSSNTSTEAVAEETEGAKRKRLLDEATKLVRIRVTCMNPNKREWDGEIITAGNSVVGTHRKFVPFNVEWHVPNVIYQQLLQRECQIFVTSRTKNGVQMRQGKLIKEFGIEVLPQLTQEELYDLAQQQAMAHSID